MIVALMTLAALLSPATASAVQITASSERADFPPAAALDGNDTTEWCAAEKIKPGESDWWQVDFESSPRTLGAIHMKSGLFKDGILQGHKIREFAWEVQTTTSHGWTKIPEASLYANRYQLIFRFTPVPGVTKLRLVSNARDPDEVEITGSSYPCLREVTLYDGPDANIPVTPWALAVATWEEGNVFDALSAPEGRFDVEAVVRQARAELTGRQEIDVSDAVWIGEFHPIRATREVQVKDRPHYRINGKLVAHDKVPVSKTFVDWILHEPAPSYLLLSGSYWDFTKESPHLLSSFYRFQHQHKSTFPTLGVCGGHQLTAMVLANKTYADFTREFTPSKPSHAVTTCGSEHACGFFYGSKCCREEGLRTIVANVTGAAMANPYSSNRVDMLFNLIPGAGSLGFDAYLHHWDSVNPKRVYPEFDIIGTYPRKITKVSRRSPTLVQAMKLRGELVYGTQFHWDESTPWDCKRDEGHRNMERVLKNFVLIALNRAGKAGVELSASSVDGPHPAAALTDLDRATMWCASSQENGDAWIKVRLSELATLDRVLLVEGTTRASAARQSYRFETSQDGKEWTEIGVRRQSLFEAQKNGSLACESGSGPWPGAEDGQSVFSIFEKPVTAGWLRVWVHGPGPAASTKASKCLRELMVF